MASLTIPIRGSETVEQSFCVEPHSHSTNGHGPLTPLGSAEGTKQTQHSPGPRGADTKQRQGESRENPPCREEGLGAAAVPARLLRTLGTFSSRDSQGPWQSCDVAMVTEAVHREGRAPHSASSHRCSQRPRTRGRDGARVCPHPDSRSASDLDIELAAGVNLLASRHHAHLIILSF